MAHLLLVDDDQDVVKAFGGLLRSEGHEVRTASTGEEGLELLRQAPLPDVVVLDVEMPMLGGLGMAHEMLLHDAGEEKIPIVLMSARTDIPQLAKRLGTPYFLQKPSTAERLLETLGRALRGRQAPSSA